MLPLIIMAAASILQNKQKQQQERQQVYLDAMNQRAEAMGGHPYLANVIGKEAAIDRQGADYSALLGLVGKGGSGGDSSGAVAADDGTGDPGIISHYNPMGDDVDDALSSFDRYRGWR